MSIIHYLDQIGLENVWSKIDTNFMRKNGAEEKVLFTSGSIASANNNSKNTAKKIVIRPSSGSVSSVNLCFCGKNLLPNPGTKTANGITWEYDSDGFLTVNGKATAQTDYYFIGQSSTITGYEYFAPPGTYTFHLEKVSGNGSITFYCSASKNTGQTSDGTKVQIDNSGDETYTLPTGVNCRIMLRVASGQSVNNLKLKVQVEKGSLYTGYVPPYRESVAVNLSGNTIDSDSELIISEDNSVKISKSTGDIDLSGSYNFSKLQIPSFRVFNGVRNSSDITEVEYYSFQLGDDILSNTELVKYLNGIPSSILGNEPITTSNLNTIIDYILSGGGSPTEHISAMFSIPNQEFDLPSNLASGKVINLTSVSSNGITVSYSSISVPKKTYINFSGKIIFTAKNATSTVDVSMHLYAKINSQYYYLAGADFTTGFNKSKTATMNSTIELPSDSNTITLVCYGNLDGANANKVINGLQSDGNISVSEVDLTEKALSAMKNNMAILSSNVNSTSVMAKYSFRQASIYMTDSEITEVLDYVSEWASNRKYYIGQVISYNNKYYRVSQDHTSQDQWLPGSQGTEALYYEIVIAPDGIIVWKKPSGSHDAPNKNDLRHYPNEDSPIYKSLIDGNAYSPDTYPAGWEIQE